MNHALSASIEDKPVNTGYSVFIPSSKETMSSVCEYVLKVVRKSAELELALWYAQPVAERSAILAVRLYDASGERITTNDNLIRSASVPRPYIFIPPQTDSGLYRVGTLTETQNVSTVKVSALAWPTLEPLKMDSFPKSFITLERSSLDVAPGERVRTNIIPGRPSGSSK